MIINFWGDLSTRSAIDAAVAATGLPASQLIRMLILRYLPDFAAELGRGVPREYRRRGIGVPRTGQKVEARDAAVRARRAARK
jgi:hypothetical protein